MAEWHYERSGQQAGPVTEAQLRNMLRAGEVSTDDRVWREGMPDWKSASAVAELLAAPSIPDDSGPVLHIGSEFAIGHAHWLGRVVASPKAFYLRKDGQPGHGGGFVGVLLHAAMVTHDGTRTCTVAELPKLVRAELDYNSKMGGKDAVVIPRETVSLVRASKMNNMVLVKAGDTEFQFTTAVWRLFKVPRVLTEMGWTLNQELAPAAAAQHDTRTPEEQAAAQKRNASTLERVIYIVIAVLVLAGLVALGVFLQDR